MKKVNYLLFMCLIAFFAACVDDDDSTPPPDIIVEENEEELITTVNLSFQNSDTARTFYREFTFSDADGPGGNAPSIETITLEADSQLYFVSVQFLDESDPNDVEDITAEILAEADDHIVCYELKNAGGVVISRTDRFNDLPLGLFTTWNTLNNNSSDSTSLTITLKHQPGIKNGSCDIGETDVEVTFPLRFN